MNIDPRRLRFSILTLAAIVLHIPEPLVGAEIPEPGFLMFGTISYSGVGLAPTNVEWQISSSSSSLAVNSTLVVVNGQTFYVATVPFESRLIGGVSIGSPTPNTLPLDAVPTTYARLPTVNGASSAIIYASSGVSNTFTFGPADRGRVERVDLSVSAPSTFAQWLAQYGLPVNSDPNSDPTHKGMTLLQQYLAGLNPNDPASTFKFLGIQPSRQGLQIQWSSADGEVYALEQATTLAGPFSLIQSNIVATPGTNTFVIPAAPTGSALFLRILIQ